MYPRLAWVPSRQPSASSMSTGATVSAGRRTPPTGPQQGPPQGPPTNPSAGPGQQQVAPPESPEE